MRKRDEISVQESRIKFGTIWRRFGDQQRARKGDIKWRNDQDSEICTVYTLPGTFSM